MSQLPKLQKVEKNLREGLRVKSLLLDKYLSEIVEVANEIVEVIREGNKIIIFGNGGSAADAQHIAAEFTGRFQHERRPLPALALTTNTSEITAIGNDYGYEYTFSRPVKACGIEGDLAWGISTSGNSENVIRGIKVAKELGLKTFTLPLL